MRKFLVTWVMAYSLIMTGRLLLQERLGWAILTLVIGSVALVVRDIIVIDEALDKRKERA